MGPFAKANLRSRRQAKCWKTSFGFHDSLMYCNMKLETHVQQSLEHTHINPQKTQLKPLILGKDMNSPTKIHRKNTPNTQTYANTIGQMSRK